MEDNIQSVYNKLVSYGYEGTEDDFRNYISDDANIPSVYDKFVSKGYQGTEDDFRGYLGITSHQPAQRVDVSDVEQADQPFVPTMEPQGMQPVEEPIADEAGADGRFKPSWGWERSQRQDAGQAANAGDDNMMRMHRAGKPDWSGYQQQQYEQMAGQVNAKYGIPTQLSTENYDSVSQRLANLDKEYDRIAERQSIFVDDDIEPSWVARDNARLASLNEERDALRAYKTAFGATDERQGYEQRVGSVFDEIDNEGVAERAWDNAEKRTAEAQSGEPYNVAGIFNMGVEKLKYHDLQRMADDAWNMLGAEKQQEITDKLYEVLKDYYPDADEQSLREGAEKMARQQSNQRVFDVAVENNAPKNALDHFFRKAVGMNSVIRIVEGMERKAAGTTGDWEAREVAEQEFDNGWHKVVGIGGTVTGFLFDPIARVSGGAGGALAKGGVSLLERAAGAAATRKFATTLGGRALTGALAGAGNLGTYEAANEAVDQLRWGGTRLQDQETGRYIIGDYSGGQILKRFGHGALMGSTTGIIAPMIGNVSDKLVNATGSTAGKTALRTGEIALGTVAEGTVFSIPEFVDTYIEYGDAIAALSDENSPAYIADEAERSKAIEELVSKRKGAMMDVWTDNMAMMAGFKAQHILKSAPQRIAELRSSGRGKAGFETHLRDMLDGKEGLGLTEDEKRELNRSGYGDLNNLVDEYQDYVKSRKNQTVRPDRLLQDGGGELGDIPYNRFEQLMGDQSVSESARAKMYYYITGNVLPMSTVTGSTFTEVKDPSGNVVGYQVQSMGNNGVITSKTFRNEKAARVEENKILRQVELNAVDGGERWFDNTSEMRGGEQKTSKDVRSDLFNKYYVDIDKAVEKEPTRRSKVEQQAVDEYIKTLWGDVIQEQKAEERQHQETKAEMLRLKAASEGLAEDLMTEDDPTTLKSAGRDMRDARRALSDKIGEERMQTLENMDEDQLATAYSEADADTQTLMKKWLISSDQDAVAEGLSQRSVSAVGQFKESIVSFFENNAASGDAQRSKLANGMLTLVDVDGSPYIVVGTHGRMYTVKDVNGNARMVDASQCKNERDVSLDQFVLEQTAPELDRYAALAEAFNGTDYTPGQVAVVGEGGRGKQVMVLGVDGENVTYADGYTVGKDGQVQVVAERTVPKQQFRDMVEQWEKKAEQDAKRQASLTNVPVSQMEAGMRFPVEWRGEIMTAEVVEEGGKKSVNIVGQDGSVVERGIDDFTDEDWQAIRTVAPEPASDVVAEAKKSNIGVGDEVSYNGEVGGALSGTVVEVRDNGLVTFETPDGDRYTKWGSLLKVEKPAVDETPADVKPEQENKPVEIPRTESGDIAHSLLDVNDRETYNAAVREEVENALAFAKDGDAAYVENNLVAAQAAVEEAEKKVPTAQGAAQRRAELETIGNERAAARNLVDFWKEVSKEKSKKVWEDLQNPKEVSNFAADPEKQQEWVDSHYDDIINGYVATYGNKLDPDELRKALKPIGYDGSNVEEFRNQEIRLRDDLYGRMLKAAVDSGNPSITILTGVGGAGKSTATQNMDLSGRGLVFDAALNKPKKLAAAIKKAKDAGMKDIQVVAVKNDAPTAFENTLRRGLSEGRFLPLEYFTKSYQDNQGKIAEIRERYPDVEIVSYDNSGNNGRGVTIDEASNWDYTIDDETLSKLLDIYENGIDQGRFTADQAAAIGRGLSEITWSRGSRAAELDRRISRIERRIRQDGDGLLRSEVSAQRSGSGRRDLGSAALGNEGYGGSNPRPAGQGSGAEGAGDAVGRFASIERGISEARANGESSRAEALTAEKAEVIQEYLDSIKTDDAYVLTADNYESVLTANGANEKAIQKVRDMYAYTRREHKLMGGFNIDGKIYVFADDVRSIDDARSTYVHERQHNINDKDVNLLPEVEAAAGRDELLSYVQALSGTHAYDNKTHTVLADEFLAMAMEVAYRTDDVETALREMGIENDELINIIKRLDDEQRTSDSLANARRREGRDTYVDNNGQGSGRPDGTDQGRRPAEVGGQGLRPDEGGRQETEGVRVSDEGVTSISDAAEKEGSGIEVGGDTRFNIATEPQLQRQIKDYVKTRDAQNAGWTDEKVSAVVAETEDLIKAIDNALSGEKFYKEWSGRMPTVKVDWRDGEEKPTVTWTRGNIDYKYDMSADLLCINNEGMEDVLSSPTMVDLMLAMQKGKKGFTSDDYMTLYNTLDDLGFVVPCKGCFDAAARFKMLPSTSQKFVDLVNETIDRRNKDKEAFDNMLRARAAKAGSALPNGLPSSAKNKEEAVEIGVAGDDLTEHITWTQLMSAEGQTKALYDWGGVFRAWQRTGAGRPKDKLLPEPYSGDIMSPFATIVAPYGEKTPSFREYEVNVGTGLRRNSHSEFRPILAVDEIQFMRDAYLRNLMVFKYMKELDDVRLFGKMGVKFNMSFFPAFVDGTPAAGLDKDGNYIASEESVGSREFEYVGEDGRKHYDGMKGFQEAQKYVNDNVSLSSVVFSVPHLIKAFTDVPTPTDKSGVWGSLIPFHNSGAVKSQIKKQGLGDERAASPKDKFEVEAMTDYDKGVTNFEQVQNDRFGEGWVIVEGKKNGTAVEPGHKLEFANGTHYYNERLGLHLFGSFYIYDNEIPSDMDLTDGNYSKADLKKLGHEYSIDYNDKVRELNSDYGYKEAVDEYVDFMRSIGLVPRFDFTVPEATFLEMCERAKVDPRHPKLGWKGEGNGWSPADAESYYSLWCDYGMTDPATGKWSPHRPVGYIDENGERSFRMPDNTVDIVREGVARYSERKRVEESRVNEAITEFTRRSVDAGKLSEEDASRILGDAGIDFGAEQDIDGNEGVRFSIVEDPDEIARLESEPTEIGYRNVVLNEDGTLGSPMADRLGKKGAGRAKTSGFEFGKWEKSDEHPELATEDGKIDLIKPDGKPVQSVDYNPYIHMRPTLVNKQFKQAWERPNLVYVRTEYPASELTSGYHADKAKKSVGRTDWNGGELILSRWDKPVEIVPWEEVADDWMKEFGNEGIHFDIIPPKLLPILTERGANIIAPHKGMGKACNDAYNEWLKSQGGDDNGGGTRFRITDQQDADYMDAVSRGDMETAHRMAMEAAKAAGYIGSSDFRMSHTAPSGRDGFSKSIANPEGIYPDDLYSPQGALYYGDGDEMMDRASAAVFRRIHGNPDAMVKIYRAVPKSLKESKLRNGDWVTINRQYAVEHGERNLDNYKIIEDDVPAKFVYTDGNSLHEQGYDDGQEYAYQDTKNNRKLIDAVTYDDDGNVIPLSKRFNKRNPDPRFSIIGEKGSANDETAIDERYDAGVLSRREMLAETLLDMAQRNKDDNQAKMDAIRAVARALNETMKTSDNPNFDIAMQDRSVASAQRTYDKATVDGIVRLARLMSKSDLFKDFSRGEVNRLLTLVKNAAGRKDISQQANNVADMMLQHAVKEMDGILKKQLNVKGAKTNAQGVMEQGRLDLQGQRMVDSMKRGMELDDASLQELIDEANDGMGSDNESKAANAAVDYQGYMLAKQYIDDIKASKAEEDRMRDDIRKKEQEVKDGELDRKAYNEFVNETERAIRENKVQRVNAYGRLLTSVGQDIKDSFGRAKAFRDAQMEHVNEIHHNANSDLEGVPSSEHSTADNKLINSSAARFLLRPVADFDEMLRFLGRKSVDGKGYLFNRFMPAFTKASDTEHKNKYADHQELDAKVSDVFGRKMRWSDLFAVEGSLPTINVRFRDGGEMKDHELTQGKALYVYMVNKMTDGRMKLRAMGITDDDVQAIKDQLDPRFVELADWVQGEFLPKLRERYNEVHTRMFGAPMDAIEDYFRLEINDRSRGREMDISAPESDMRPSTVTGSIKKRVKNSTALDLTNTDAFDMLLGNIDEMEHWAAFAEFNRDINILLSYNKFRNRVMNMTSARFGSGETLWNNFVDTARIVAGVYQPKVRAKDLDNALVNMSKGVTAAKISFRLFTALKQLMSYPAYLSEASPVELVKSSNPVGAVKAWNWAMENLPGFAKRWQSRQAGDTRLKETDVDWQLWKNKIIETAGRLGMTPNAFVDAMTVAMGSKAVYETALKRYMKDGYSKETAEEKAKMDASLAYNETQQSSEAAYISGMQLDRTLASVALTVFRNASIAYGRRFMRSLANMKKMMRNGFREENMEYAKKQMMRDGLTEEQAEDAAKRSYRRAWAKSAADLAIFGWVLQFAWNLSLYLPYLLFGKDDDMKDEMLKDAALHAVAGGVEGMSGGSIMSEYYNTMRKRKEYEDKYGKAPAGQSSGINFTTLPIMSDIKTTLQHFDQDDVRGINDIVNLVIQAGVGVNPQTITDAVVAIVDATNGDMETGKEIGMLLMRLAQVPQSQVDNIYIDELGMTAKDAKNMDVDAMAKRYARYKNRRDTFFTGWMYDEGEREKAEDRYAKRFDKKIQERIQAMDDDELTDALEDANPEMKQKFNKEYASRQGISYTKSSTEYGAVYDQLVTPKDISEDAVLRQAKKDAKETGDDRLYKEIDSFQRQLTNIKKGASYHIGEVKVKDEDSPGLGKGEKTDESVMRNIRKQRELFMRRHGLTQ